MGIMFAIRSFSLYNTTMVGIKRGFTAVIGNNKQKSCSRYRRPLCRSVGGRAWLRRRLWKGLHGGLAFFFAFLLPIICWGSLNDPTHPHAGPHFLFAEPVAHGGTAVYFLVAQDKLRGGSTVAQMPHIHRAGAQPHSHDVGTTDAVTDLHDQPSARSAPVTTLAQLLLLVVWAIWLLRHAFTPLLLQYVPLLFLRLSAPHVPTPPPRPFAGL